MHFVGIVACLTFKQKKNVGLFVLLCCAEAPAGSLASDVLCAQTEHAAAPGSHGTRLSGHPVPGLWRLLQSTRLGPLGTSLVEPRTESPKR